MPASQKQRHRCKSQLAWRLSQEDARECQKGNIKPKADPVEIMQYAASVYSGIEMNCIINACYNQGSMKIKYEPRKLFDVHAKAMIMLMGGEI